VKWIFGAALATTIATTGHAEPLGAVPFTRLVSDNRLAVLQVFNYRIAAMLDRQVEGRDSPLNSISESAFQSMPSSKYWQRFSDNPFRAKEELANTLVRIYGQIELIRDSNGEAILELHGASRFRTVTAHMSQSPGTMEYVKSVSVGVSANLVCHAGEFHYGDASAADCIPYRDALGKLTWAFFEAAVEDPLKVVRISQSAKAAEKIPDMHWLSTQFAASVYGATEITDCSPKMFVGCAESLAKAEAAGEIDDWARSFGP